MALTKINTEMLYGFDEETELQLENYLPKEGGTLTGDLTMENSDLILGGAVTEKEYTVVFEPPDTDTGVIYDHWSMEKVNKIGGKWNYEDEGIGGPNSSYYPPTYKVRQFPKAILDHFPVPSVPSGEIIEESTTFSLTSDGTHGIMVDYGPKFGYRGKYAVWKCDKPYEWDENSEVVCIGEFGGDSGPSPQPDWPATVPRTNGYSQWRRSAGLQFSPDGLKLFHTGADELSLTLGWHQLTKPYDISSSLNLNGSDFPALNDTIDCTRYNPTSAGYPAGGYSRVVGLSFRPDGTAFYLLWYIYKTNHWQFLNPTAMGSSGKFCGCTTKGIDQFNLTVTQQNLNTPWDISESSLGDHYTMPRDPQNAHPCFSCLDMWPICASITWSSNGQYMYTSTGIPYTDRDYSNKARHTVRYINPYWEDHPMDISQGGGWHMQEQEGSEVHNGMAWNEDGSTFYSMIRRGAWEDAHGYTDIYSKKDTRAIFETRVFEVVPPPPPMEIDLNPQDGTMQTYTMGDVKITANFQDGQSMTVMLEPREGSTVEWPDIIWGNNDGLAPVLTEDTLVITLWQVSGSLYGLVIKEKDTLQEDGL